MYGISSARNVSATTSLPNPGALVPVRLAGRSSTRSEGCARFAERFSAAGAALAFTVVTGASEWSTKPASLHKTGPQALTQPRQDLQASIAVGRLHADLALKVPNG